MFTALRPSGTYEGGQLVAVHEWFGASVSAPDRRRAAEIIASIDRVAGAPWTGTRTASGWGMSYPGSWDAQLQPNRCPGKTKGPSAIIMTNSNFVFHPTFSACRTGPARRWVLAGFPRDGVAVALEPPLPLGLTPTHLTLPPSLSSLHPTGGIVGGPKELFGVFPAAELGSAEVRGACVDRSRGLAGSGDTANGDLEDDLSPRPADPEGSDGSDPDLRPERRAMVQCSLPGICLGQESRG